jgi:hypothetical protein
MGQKLVGKKAGAKSSSLESEVTSVTILASGKDKNTYNDA